ncbi:MAG: 3-hydroxyacyl-CoA dehydrogenase NAD-binding domain-containing protein [Porticoccaceae bacterium]
MKINDVTTYQLNDHIAVVSLNSPPVNAISAEVRAGICAAFRKAFDDDAAKAIVLICEGRTFFSGADIKEFGKPQTEPTLPDVLNVIENSPKPVIAAIHGSALGGGLEVALVAHYRVAVPSAKCGLPEVNLGLIPGAGGTQRLPRIVGVEKALEMITSGKPISATAANKAGLVDALVGEGKLLEEALAYAKAVVDAGKPLKRVRDLDEKIIAARANPQIFADFRKANAKKFRGCDAPEAAIKAVEAAVNLPFDESIKREREMFLALREGFQSAAQRHVFFAERQAAKVDDIDKDTPVVEIKKVGIIGAGTMGGGIAMNFLSAGLPVVLTETQQQALDRGLGNIEKNYQGSVKAGRISQEACDRCMSLLNPSLEMADLADCDLIIEAVFEQMAIKKEVFAKLDKVAKAGAILASNTSYLDLDEIAAATSRPEAVIGLHFFSPANIMKLLEIVRGEKTSKTAVATALNIAKTIGKTGVVVGVCFGFVGNRILAQRQREAEKLILEGAMPWDVDRVLYDFGFAMGPFAMRDLAGLDIGWDKNKTSSSSVREILNEMGRFGQKAKAGFYDYDDNRKSTPSPLVEKVILDFCQKHDIQRREVSAEEILQRCLYVMVNEGANILLEGKASRASDIDIIWITGYGWPKYTGGPMFWAEHEGLEKILNTLKKFHQELGDDFKPSPLLERLVAEGKGFKDI